MKKAVMLLITFVFVCAIAAVSGFISYNLTVETMRRNTANSTQRELRTSEAAERRENPRNRISESEPAVSNEATITEAEYYMVRLEGESLGIYACDSEKEEFLYNERIYTNDLSEWDFTVLEEGVRLGSTAELTGFLEDFTS